MRNRHLYPKDWEKISLEIRSRKWQCQRCNRCCRQAGESLDKFIDRTGLPATEVRLAPARWRLTVAHLNHEPSDCRPENLAVLCTPCHLRYDAAQHVRSRRINRRKFLEAQGQLVLFEVV